MSYLAEPKKPRAVRGPLWSPQFLLQELESNATITEICKRNTPDPKNWRALYNDVRRWMREDDAIGEAVRAHIKKTDSKKRTKISGGRPGKENVENSDWRLKYCEKLLETKSRVKAADVTPFSPDEIYQKLNENYSSFDKEFADLVHMTEMRLVAWAEEEIWNALGEATTPKDKAWIAKEILKVRDRVRWGEKLDLHVQGTVQHRHELDRGKIIAELVADQRAFFEKNDKRMIESGEILEAEVVSDS